jgi:hypothetical protein
MAPNGKHADLWGLAAACPHPSAPAQEGRSAAFYQAAHLAGAGGPSASGGAFAAQAAPAVKAPSCSLHPLYIYIYIHVYIIAPLN